MIIPRVVCDFHLHKVKAIITLIVNTRLLLVKLKYPNGDLRSPSLTNDYNQHDSEKR